MRSQLKNLFLLSSLGSVCIGASVALARRKKKPDGAICRKIPRSCSRIYIWTEPVESVDQGAPVVSRERYLLQLTSFKVWSVLDLPVSPGKENAEGSDVYHVTCWRETEVRPEDGRVETGSEATRYYGTVAVVSAQGERCGKNSLARGAFLEIRKCYVGGASNGIETGEVHRSAAPILNYRFEYSAEVARGAADRVKT